MQRRKQSGASTNRNLSIVRLFFAFSVIVVVVSAAAAAAAAVVATAVAAAAAVALFKFTMIQNILLTKIGFCGLQKLVRSNQYFRRAYQGIRLMQGKAQPMRLIYFKWPGEISPGGPFFKLQPASFELPDSDQQQFTKSKFR